MGVRPDIVIAKLDTTHGARLMRDHLNGKRTLAAVARALDVPRDVAEEWFEEWQARKLEQRLWTIAEGILGPSPLPTFVRRCASLPFEYKHDAEMFWIAISQQMAALDAQGHDLDVYRDDDEENVCTRCELVPADAPRETWPQHIAREVELFHQNETPPIARVTPARARALQAMGAEVIWAHGDAADSPDSVYELADGIAILGTTLDEIGEGVRALAALANHG